MLKIASSLRENLCERLTEIRLFLMNLSIAFLPTSPAAYSDLSQLVKPLY